MSEQEFFRLSGPITGSIADMGAIEADIELIKKLGGFSGPPTLTLRVSARQYLESEFPQKDPATAEKLAAMSQSNLDGASVDFTFTLEPADPSEFVPCQTMRQHDHSR